MRTTLTIDDDVLTVAKAMARQQQRSVGQVVSDLARRALHKTATVPARRNGIPLLPRRDGAEIATLDIVNALRDEIP